MASQQRDNLNKPGGFRKSKYLTMFPRSFVSSYGQPLSHLADKEVLSRLHNWNCEWLKRPRVAISELAETIQFTLPIFQKSSGKQLDKLYVTYYKNLFQPMEDMLSRMNNKDRQSGNEIKEKELRTFMSLIQEDEEFEKKIQDLFEVAGAAFVFSTQLMALQTLLWNPRDFAEKLHDERTTKDFKAEPNQREMREYLFNNIVTDISERRKKQARSSSGSLWNTDRETRRTASPTRERSRQRKRGSSTGRRRDSGWNTDDSHHSSRSRRRAARSPSISPDNRRQTSSKEKKRPANTRRSSPKELPTKYYSPSRALSPEKDSDKEAQFSDAESSPSSPGSPHTSTGTESEEHLPLASSTRKHSPYKRLNPVQQQSDDEKPSTSTHTLQDVKKRGKRPVIQNTDDEDDPEEAALFITQNKFRKYDNRQDEDREGRHSFVELQRTPPKTPTKKPTTG